MRKLLIASLFILSFVTYYNFQTDFNSNNRDIASTKIFSWNSLLSYMDELSFELNSDLLTESKRMTLLEKGRSEIESLLSQISKERDVINLDLTDSKAINHAFEVIFANEIKKAENADFLYKVGLNKLAHYYPSVRPINYFKYKRKYNYQKSLDLLTESGINANNFYDDLEAALPNYNAYHGVAVRYRTQTYLDGFTPSQVGKTGFGVYVTNDYSKKMSFTYAESNTRGIASFKVNESATYVDLTTNEEAKRLFTEVSNSDLEDFCERYSVDIVKNLTNDPERKAEEFAIKNVGIIKQVSNDEFLFPWQIIKKAKQITSVAGLIEFEQNMYFTRISPSDKELARSLVPNKKTIYNQALLEINNQANELLTKSLTLGQLSSDASTINNILFVTEINTSLNPSFVTKDGQGLGNKFIDYLGNQMISSEPGSGLNDLEFERFLAYIDSLYKSLSEDNFSYALKMIEDHLSDKLKSKAGRIHINKVLARKEYRGFTFLYPFLIKQVKEGNLKIDSVIENFFSKELDNGLKDLFDESFTMNTIDYMKESEIINYRAMPNFTKFIILGKSERAIAYYQQEIIKGASVTNEIQEALISVLSKKDLHSFAENLIESGSNSDILKKILSQKIYKKTKVLIETKLSSPSSCTELMFELIKA